MDTLDLFNLLTYIPMSVALSLLLVMYSIGFGMFLGSLGTSVHKREFSWSDFQEGFAIEGDLDEGQTVSFKLGAYLTLLLKGPEVALSLHVYVLLWLVTQWLLMPAILPLFLSLMGLIATCITALAFWVSFQYPEVR